MSRPTPKLWARSVRRVALAAATLIAVAGLLRLSGGKPAWAQGQAKVPDDAFAGARGWINSRPITMTQLRGKIVLLDFWTYCCINCHHVLPDLARLEQKYKDSLVVIGIHTAKFDAEKDLENIRRKVDEYRIKHPVANDADQAIWTKFGVNSWPTLALIDSTGTFVGSASGEGNYEILDRKIGELVARGKARGTLDETPLVFPAESDNPHPGVLRSPGKVVADAAGKRLFVADTGHNRVVVTDLKGRHMMTVGSGEEGLKDGSAGEARFNRPQGMCLVGETLYVADTENHAIRAVDLAARTVQTVAGTGEQTHARRGSGPGKATALNSPWDVLPEPGGKALLIAMAGPHQLWRLDLTTGNVGVWAGTSREDIVDGSHRSASFAQPSGLATDGKRLFVADSEGSCVRSVGLGEKGEVTTLAGAHDVPNVLFSFGDVDGAGPAVRLQHCLGLAQADGVLYIADTYNNKVKACDLRTGTVQGFAGSGRPGEADGPNASAQFYQPGGLSVAGGTLYVADTNNDAIRAVDLSARTVATVALADVPAPASKVKPPTFPRAAVETLPTAQVNVGKGVTVAVRLALPAGLKLNPGAPLRYLVEAPGHPDILGPEVSPAGGRAGSSLSFEIPVPLSKPAQAGEELGLKVSVSAFVCKEGAEGYCTTKNYVWNVPVQFVANGSDRVTLTTKSTP